MNYKKSIGQTSYGLFIRLIVFLLMLPEAINILLH